MSFNMIEAKDPLQSTLRRTPTTAAFSRLVIREIWNHEFTPHQYIEYRGLYESYFTHIFDELCTAACSGSLQIPNFTHIQILEVVRNLKSRSCTKEEAAQSFSLSTGHTDEDLVARAITLAAGLLVPLNFKSVGGARRGELVSWEDGDSLSQTLAKGVTTMANGSRSLHDSCMLCTSTWRFSRIFNARQLAYLTGFEIIWTSNLLDHLLVQDDDEKTKVHIFHHARILEDHSRMEQSIISPELLYETLDTLALLIPRTDRQVRKWYTQRQKLYILDPSVLSLEYLKPEKRSIDHFVFWGVRLRKLKQAFDDHEPDGPLQWWRDDRKPVRWWTFWIAALVLLLTVVFGLIQSLISLLQLMKP